MSTVAQKVQTQVLNHIARETGKPQGRNKVTLVKVATSASERDGVRVQRRNTNHHERAVAVFYSPALNMAWLGTHLHFGTKTKEAAMQTMRTDKATKCLEPLQKATDVEMVLFAKDVQVGDALELAKLQAYNEYESKGFIMLGRKPKVAQVA